MTGNNILYDHGTDYERLINSLPPPPGTVSLEPLPHLTCTCSKLFGLGGGGVIGIAQPLRSLGQTFWTLGQFYSFLGYWDSFIVFWDMIRTSFRDIGKSFRDFGTSFRHLWTKS